MKILMISDVYFPRINGVSTSIETFRKELIKLGHQVTLLVPSYPIKIEDDSDILRIPSRYLIFDHEDRMLKPFAVLKRLDEFKQANYDIIHIQTPFIAHYLGSKLAQQLGIPCIETYHTYFEEYLFHYLPLIPKNALRYLARKFTSTQCNHVDRVIVPSTAMREKLIEYRVTVPIQVLPTGIDIDKFKCTDADDFMHQHNIDRNRPRLVHVGRIAHEKNIEFLIDVLKRVKQNIPDILLIVAGEGPALKHIKAYVKKLSLEDNIIFIGYLDRNTQLLSCYCSGEIFLFSSKTETQGLVLLEAMSLGVPVVSTAIMGTKDILHAQQGALVSPDDVEQFAERVSLLISDEALRQQLSYEANSYAHEWSAKTMAEKQLDFYDDVILAYQAKQPRPSNQSIIGRQQF